MSNPYLGEIRMFAGNFPPQGWAFCNGQLLSISVDDTLFSLIGTTYGGDGQSTFAVPDLRGRVPIHQGNSQGQSYFLGQSGGTETVTLSASQLPSHTHLMSASAAAPAAVPAGGLDPSMMPLVPASATPKPKMYADPGAMVSMAPGAIGAAGGAQPHNNMAPSLGLHFIIALVGVYPSQN